MPRAASQAGVSPRPLLVPVHSRPAGRRGTGNCFRCRLHMGRISAVSPPGLQLLPLAGMAERTGTRRCPGRCRRRKQRAAWGALCWERRRVPRGPGQSSGAAPGGTSVKRTSSTAAAGAELTALHSAWPSVRWERGWGCRGGVAQAELLAGARRTPTISLPAPAPRGFLPLCREAGVWMSEI